MARSTLDPAWVATMRKRIEDVREAIDAECAVEALNEHNRGNKVLDKDRLKGIEIALKHKLPVLKDIQHTGEGGGPIQVISKVERVIRRADTPDRDG